MRLDRHQLPRSVVILLCLRFCPTLRDEFVTQAYVHAARDGRGIPEPFKRGPTARAHPASGSSICLTGTCVRETSLPGGRPTGVGCAHHAALSLIHISEPTRRT